MKKAKKSPTALAGDKKNARLPKVESHRKNTNESTRTAERQRGTGNDQLPDTTER